MIRNGKGLSGLLLTDFRRTAAVRRAKTCIPNPA
jgi:hypothetical protein